MKSAIVFEIISFENNMIYFIFKKGVQFSGSLLPTGRRPQKTASP
jgi:hypothetical protein